jgi:hypothetical protein
MSGIDAGMLASMRAIISTELLPDTCRIISMTEQPDGEGGVAVARGTAGTAACRLDAMQGREQVSGGAIEPFISYMVSLPYNAVVLPQNLIETGGVDYAVKSVNRGQSWCAVVRVEVERM